MAGDSFAEVSLGEIADFRNGKAISPENYSLAGRHIVYGSNGQIARSDEVLYREPVIVIGRVGAYCGCVHFVPKSSWITDNAIVALPKAGYDIRFLFYLLGSLELQRTAIGSAQPLMTQGGLKVVRTKVPPLAEQKAIAAVLGALDDKIELNRRMNATLEAMARALFQSWFVDFDPVRAKLDGRPPVVLDPTTVTLFPDHFEDSQLGQIPKGWEVARLDEIASIMMGLSPDGESYNANEIGKPLINRPVEFGDYFPVKTKWTEVATRFAAEGDLIFCVRGSTTGRRVVSDGEYGIGRGVCAIRAKGGYHSFLYQTINVGLDRLLEKTTGSVFPSLSAPDIKGFPVLKPSKGILEAYERTAHPFIQRIQQNHHQSRTLATLRDTLLPKLLSGELSVTGTHLEKILDSSLHGKVTP
jgi:type I restriction enzyme S subunit